MRFNVGHEPAQDGDSWDVENEEGASREPSGFQSEAMFPTAAQEAGAYTEHSHPAELREAEGAGIRRAENQRERTTRKKVLEISIEVPSKLGWNSYETRAKRSPWKEWAGAGACTGWGGFDLVSS